MNHLNVYADFEGDSIYLRVTKPDGTVVTLVTITPEKASGN